MKTNLHWLDRTLLTSPYCYALCLDEKAFRKEQKHMRVPKDERVSFVMNSGSGATAHFFNNPSGDGLCVIVTLCDDPKLDLIQIYCELVHEAVHIWQEIKESLGEDTPGQEGEAYAVQAIAQNLMYAYQEQSKCRR